MSMESAPTGPRAMRNPEISLQRTIVPVSKDLYPKDLYPRLALYEQLAKFEDEPRPRSQSNDEITEGRRNFLDSFAYLCDSEKGGATTTAAGLQWLPLSNILWLAANEGIRGEVDIFAGKILDMLKGVAKSPNTRKIVENKIFLLAVENCDSRLETYKSEVQKYATRCRMELREVSRLSAQPDVAGEALIRKLSEPRNGMPLAEMVDYCYDMRQGDEMKQIQERSRHYKDDFGSLIHFIGRLGATRSATKRVVDSMIKVPSLQQISCVRKVKAPDVRKFKMNHDTLRPYDIVRDICQDSTSQNPLKIQIALHSIVERDLPFMKDNLRDKLVERDTLITRVHAELQIADQFSRHGLDFVDKDRYIGCSKPACYFCFNWLCGHRHDYIPPATHSKIILGCRGPDDDLNETGTAILQDFYAKLHAKLGQDIMQFLEGKDPENGRRDQYQSTEGSSYAQSRI